MAEEVVPKRSTPHHAWLLRGESVIASVGISVAAILMMVMAAAGWWTLRTQKDAYQISRATQVRALGEVLGKSAESMLASGDLSALRRLVLDASTSFDVKDCQITLPDGKVIASSDPRGVVFAELPEHWSAITVDAPANTGDNDLSMTIPLRVPGRGAALLQLGAAVHYPSSILWQAQTGVGLIGAVGLLLLLVVYRRTRVRLMTLGVIREALLAVERGETSPDAVTVGQAEGPEASAWNKMISETVTLKQRSIADRAQASLGGRRASDGSLDRACDALQQGMVLLDDQGRVSYLNGAAAVVLQAKREALIGTDLMETIPDETIKDAIRAAVSGSVRARKTVEVERHGEQGDSVLRFSVRPDRREGSNQVMVTIEDITQQRVAEASRQSFVTQAAHELRTPLTNIRLYVETALDEGEHDAVVRTKSLNVINQESRRLEIMIGGMLSASEIEAGSLKIHKDDVRLDNLFQELAADYQALAEDKHLTLVFDLPPKLPVIQADREKFTIALHNLIGNALKYTPSGGKVTISVKQEGKQLIVDVGDTGIGIDEKDLALIFERFYRAKDPRVSKITGTGLGLALAREVIRQHGGDVTAHSELNVGSTFTATVPIPDAA